MLFFFFLLLNSSGVCLLCLSNFSTAALQVVLMGTDSLNMNVIRVLHYNIVFAF